LSTFPFFPTIEVGLADPTYFGNNSVVDTDVFGAYGQASYTIAETVKLTAGLRYSSDEKDADIVRKEFTQADSTSFNKQGDWDSTTWKLGADWFVTDDSMLYASVSTGFKSGGFLQIEDADPYDEEEIIAWEIGSKNRFLDNRLQANISAYYYEYTDMQLRTIRDLNSIVTNAGESEIKGIEIEAVWRPVGTLELTGAYGYMDAEFTDYFNDDPNDGQDELLDLSGNRLPRSPENTLNLSIAYTWDFTAGSLTSSLFYYWADEVYFSAFNRPDNSQEDYHRTDINVTFNSASGKWYVTGAARNLEDDEVASERLLGDATLGLSDTAQWNPPRTYTLAVGYYF
jgi:iron complex outermembrane receptor protein